MSPLGDISQPHVLTHRYHMTKRQVGHRVKPDVGPSQGENLVGKLQIVAYRVMETIFE